MKKVIIYLGLSIEITFDTETSGFALYEGDKLIIYQDGYPGFNYKLNGLLEEAQWSVQSYIARKRLKQLSEVHPAFAEIQL